MYEASHPVTVRVSLKQSNTDQVVKDFMAAKSDELCPVEAILAYYSKCRVAPGPFFKCENALPLTKDCFFWFFILYAIVIRTCDCAPLLANLFFLTLGVRMRSEGYGISRSVCLFVCLRLFSDYRLRGGL